MLSQLAYKSVPLPKQGKCDYLEDFYCLCDATGNYRGLPKKERLITTTLRKPSTPVDAEWITQIYEEVYHGTYPYTEMLTSSWILEKFNDPNYIWGIFETDADAPTPNDICGCFTIVLDFQRKTAYFRGMMIRPKYQKLVALREMSFAMFWNTLHTTQHAINKCYCESRTAHNITQYLASIVGCNCQAVLLNKDQFLNQYESDALMVGYSQNAFLEDRISPLEIHPDMMELYNYFKEINHLESIAVASYPEIINDTTYIQELVEHAHIRITQELYQYRKISITILNASLTALYTPQIDVLEKIEWSATSSAEFIALTHVLEGLMANLKVKYCEWYLPAENIIETEVLLQFGYKSLGYVPAWERDPNDRFHDCIIFGKHPEFSENQRSSIQLLPQGYEVLNLVQKSQKNKEENIPSPIMVSHLN